MLIACVAKVLIILTWFGMFDEIFGELFQRFSLVILCLSQLDLRLTEQRPVSTSYCFYTTCHYGRTKRSVLWARQLKTDALSFNYSWIYICLQNKTLPLTIKVAVNH